MATTTDRALDWVSFHDPKSRQYPVRALVRSTSKPRGYSWKPGPVIDQGREGACVGFGWTGDIMSRPHACTLQNPTQYALDLYHEAQRNDDTPGENYVGTSVLAGAKVLQARGIVSEYRWAFGLDDVILALGYKGPVVLGIPWFESMYEAPGGKVTVSGRVVGGHCILARAVSVKRQTVTLLNSWGLDWGVSGNAEIGFTDLDRLLKQDGEACVPVHKAVKVAA